MSTKEDREMNFFDSDALDDEFFAEVVSRKLDLARDEFKIRLVLITPATGKNENYVSAVYRAKINVELHATKERRFVDVIIKVMLTNIPELAEFSMFPRETLLYDDLIPSLERIWRERAYKEVVFGPKCLNVTTQPYEIIVLDDLGAEGYRMISRKDGLDAHQTKLVLTKLAEFHAASVIRYQQDGEISEQLDRTRGVDAFLSTDGPYYQGYVKTLKDFKKAIHEIDDSGAAAKVIDTWSPEVLLQSFIIPAKAMKCGLKVLNHGDNWCNNMLFKVDESTGATTAVKLIDYQIAYWGSPIGDLYYFLMTSVADDVKVDCFDEFLAHYQSTLSECLRQVGYEGHIPTLSELQMDMLETRQYGVSTMLDILIAVKYDSPVEFTMEQMMDPNGMDQATLDRAFRNECYKKAVKAWLPFLHKRGLLDPVRSTHCAE